MAGAAIVLSLLVLCHTAHASDFGTYKPDKTGATDVSGILQEAIDAAMASDKILVLPPGRYWVAKPVTIHGNGFTLCSQYPVTASAVVLQGYKGKLSPSKLSNGQGPDKPEAIIKVKKPSYGLRIAGISFHYATAGVAGAPAIACARITNCGFSYCDYGLKGEPLQIVTVVACGFSHGKYGIRGRDSDAPGFNRSNLVNIYDCTFRQFSEYGVQVEGSPTNIRDCDFEHSTGGAVDLLDIYVSNIQGSYLEGCGDAEHPLIRVSPCQFPPEHVGQLNVYGNQINVNGSSSLIHVGKGAKLHAYDNRVAVKLSKGQVFVEAETPGPHIRHEQNIIRDPAIP